MSSRVAFAVLVGGAIVSILLLIRILRAIAIRNPEKRERHRRQFIHINGRLGDTLITGFTGTMVYYTYSVQVVQYSASQDIAALAERLPAELERLLGVAQLKYLPANPANSIVLCEDWSGLRACTSPSLVSTAKYAC